MKFTMIKFIFKEYETLYQASIKKFAASLSSVITSMLICILQLRACHCTCIQAITKKALSCRT